MKTTFSRTFFTAATILLAALLVLGMSFQILIRDYLTKATTADLQQDAQIIANLAAAYSIDGRLSSRDFLLNLDVASQVSDADAVICDAKGNIITCSRDPLGCTHRGLTINGELFDRAMRMGHSTDTGVLPGLYTENRYVCAQIIYSGKQAVGLVLVSTPTAQT